jgi:hypothetical protein
MPTRYIDENTIEVDLTQEEIDEIVKMPGYSPYCSVN